MMGNVGLRNVMFEESKWMGVKKSVSGENLSSKVKVMR